jgi:glycosyltransferase involved in cell wall biosynthesis
VLGQTFANYEYIIKDGGSIDGTVESLQQLGLKVISCEDHGVYDAMNQATSFCQGKFVYFLNAGDVLFDKDVLQQLAVYIRPEGGVDFYYGDVVMNNKHPYANPQDNLRLRRRISYPSSLSKFFLYRNGLCHQAWLVRKELYLQYPFDVRLKIMADYDFLLNQALRKKNKMEHISCVIVDYMGMGRSEKLIDEWLNDRRQVVCKYFSLVERLVYESVRLSAKFVLSVAYKMRLFGTILGNS